MSYDLIDILLALLIIAGVVALVALAKLLFNLSKTVGVIADTVESNRKSLDETFEDLPKITNNLNTVLDCTNGLIEDVTPKVASALYDVSNLTSHVSNITDTVADTVEVVGIAAADTASKFTNTFRSATNKTGFVKGFLNGFFKRSYLNEKLDGNI